MARSFGHWFRPRVTQAGPPLDQKTQEPEICSGQVSTAFPRDFKRFLWVRRISKEHIDPLKRPPENTIAEQVRQVCCLENNPERSGAGGYNDIHHVVIRPSGAAGLIFDHCSVGMPDHCLNVNQHPRERTRPDAVLLCGFRWLDRKFKDEIVPCPGFAQRVVIRRAIMQDEVGVREKTVIHEGGRQALDCQWMVQTTHRRRQVPQLFVRFDEQRPQIEFARPELPKPFGVDARYQVSVIVSLRRDQNGNVMAADGITCLEHLRPVVVEERAGMPDALHDVSIAHRARMSKSASGHHV